MSTHHNHEWFLRRPDGSLERVSGTDDSDPVRGLLASIPVVAYNEGWNAAIAVIDKVAMLHQNDVRVPTYKLWALTKAQRFDDSLSLADDFISKYGSDPYVYYNKALVLCSMGRFVDASNYWTMAIKAFDAWPGNERAAFDEHFLEKLNEHRRKIGPEIVVLIGRKFQFTWPRRSELADTADNPL